MSEEIYKQKILDRFQSPQYKGVLAQPHIVSTASNSLCGDKVQFHLRIDQDTIQEAKWEGEGCAISLAAADLLAESLVGKSVIAVGKISNQDMLKLLGVDLKPSRLKCATLALEAVKSGLE